MLKNVMLNSLNWINRAKYALINLLMFLGSVYGIAFLFCHVKPSPLAFTFFALFAVLLMRAFGCMVMNKNFFDLTEL